MKAESLKFAGNIPFADPLLKPYIRRYKAGEELFEQGEVGNTLFIIAEGTVQLTATRDEQELFISEIAPGHVLGEKAIVGKSPHKRFFGARAKTDVVAMEMSSIDMEDLENKNPSIVIRIFERIGKISVERLDRIDHLIKVLRPANNVERLIYLVIHFCHFEGQKTPQGTLVHLPMDTIRYYISMTPFDIETSFGELDRLGILVDQGEGTYLMTEQAKLIASIPQLRDNLPELRAV
ncbi:Crp/Fnr family transcriptional regulator [bacterium]|nr:Crp/Fnr family transcriptional regulator [bacterium]